MKIEIIPVLDNLLLVSGDIIRCLYLLNIDTSKIRHIENRMLGTFKTYPMKKSIQILNIFSKILEHEGIELVNSITGKRGFYIRDIGLYQNSIQKMEQQ